MCTKVMQRYNVSVSSNFTSYSVVESGLQSTCKKARSDLAMVLSEYAKIRILTLWRENNGPTAIVKSLEQENISTTRKTVTFFIAR